MGGEVNRESELLADIKLNAEPIPNTSGVLVTLLQSPNNTVATGTTVTGSNIYVGGGQNMTIVADMTGSTNTGILTPTLTVYGGISGLGMVAIRSITATADQAIVFRIGVAGESTGGAAHSSGVSVFNDIRLEVSNSGTVTGGSVTVRAQAVLPRK